MKGIEALKASGGLTETDQRFPYSQRPSGVEEEGRIIPGSASPESERIGTARAGLESEGIAYGDLSLYPALHGRGVEEVERSFAEPNRIFGQMDVKLIREPYYQVGAYFARLPGQPRPRQLRKVFVSAGATGTLAPLFGPVRGYPASPDLGAPAMAVLETRVRTAYHYDLFGARTRGTRSCWTAGEARSRSR